MRKTLQQKLESGYVRGAVIVGAGIGSSALATDPAFDVASLYTGAAAAFAAAATVAGGFLAIKFGAKVVKKAWAWLT